MAIVIRGTGTGGGSSSPQNIQQVLNTGNVVGAGPTVIEDFNDGAGNRNQVSNAGMDITVSSGTAVGATYHGDQLILADNQINKIVLTRFSWKITASTGAYLQGTPNNIIYQSGGRTTTISGSPNNNAIVFPVLAGTVGLIDQAVNALTGPYQFVLTDDGTYCATNDAAGQNYTVPANSTTAFPIGALITVAQRGAGKTTFVAAVGVTILSKGGNLSINGQNVGVCLWKSGTNEWFLFGDLQA